MQQGAWLTDLCARSSAELTTLFQALGLLGAALLACTCHGWKQAIDQFRAEETSIRFTDSVESAPTFFEGQVMARVLPRYVALRTLNLQQLAGSTVGQVACCLAALANKAWPELRSLHTPPLGGTQPPYSSEVSHLVAGALACPQLRELHVSNLGVFMTDAVLHSLLWLPTAAPACSGPPCAQLVGKAQPRACAQRGRGGAILPATRAARPARLQPAGAGDARCGRPVSFSPHPRPVWLQRRHSCQHCCTREMPRAERPQP